MRKVKNNRSFPSFESATRIGIIRVEPITVWIK